MTTASPPDVDDPRARDDARRATARAERARRRENRAPTGEGMVWLTGLGVSIGIVMVLGLLGLVLVEGLAVFWPPRVERVAYDDAGKRAELLGVAVLDHVKRVAVRGADGGETVATVPETQFYLADKDVFAPTFRYVELRAIRERSEPADVVRIARVRNGEVIGVPVELRLDGAAPVPADAPAFADELDRAVREAEQRRGDLLRIEKGAEGDVATRIDALKRRAQAAAGDAAALAVIAGERAALDAEYARLDAQARALHAHQTGDVLTVRLADGRARPVVVGDILDWYWPNRIGPIDRLARFAGAAWEFVAGQPRESNTEGGVFPAIFGTVAMTMLMSLVVVPFGVLAAIYLREYAGGGAFVRAVRIAINNLAGVPSIVFGAFGFGFFVYVVGGTLDQWFFADRLPTPTFGTGGILWASLTLALMTMPVVIVATEEAIAAVPRGMREGSLACGASKWQTIQKIVLPASIPGILTGTILAMARGAGEVAPLIMVGVVKLAPTLPIDGRWPFVHLERKFMHLGFHIYDLGFQSPDSDAAKPMVFATTLLLILIVLLLNLTAILLRDRLRRRYAVSAF